MKQTESDQHARRALLRAGLGIIAGAGVGIIAGAGVADAALAQTRGDQKLAARQQFAQDAEKLAPSVVQYQETPKDGAKCSGCVNFVAPAACKIVSGTINPNGWCVAYAPKEG